MRASVERPTPTLSTSEDRIGGRWCWTAPADCTTPASSLTSRPFPHRLALNVWAGAGAPQRPAGSAGLRSFELRVRDGGQLAAIAERLGARPARRTLRTEDPAGNPLELSLE